MILLSTVLQAVCLHQWTSRLLLLHAVCLHQWFSPVLCCKKPVYINDPVQYFASNSLFTVYCASSLFTIYCCKQSVYCLLLQAVYLLFTAVSSLFTVYCCKHSVYCLLLLAVCLRQWSCPVLVASSLFSVLGPHFSRIFFSPGLDLMDFFFGASQVYPCFVNIHLVHLSAALTLINSACVHRCIKVGFLLCCVPLFLIIDPLVL